jgi:hypothetical protein
LLLAYPILLVKIFFFVRELSRKINRADGTYMLSRMVEDWFLKNGGNAIFLFNLPHFGIDLAKNDLPEIQIGLRLVEHFLEDSLKM